LNSLNSGNIEKAFLYQEIDHLVDRERSHSDQNPQRVEMVEHISAINEKLKSGLKIQENSTCLMQSIVQD